MGLNNGVLSVSLRRFGMCVCVVVSYRVIMFGYAFCRDNPRRMIIRVGPTS